MEGSLDRFFETANSRSTWISSRAGSKGRDGALPQRPAQAGGDLSRRSPARPWSAGSTTTASWPAAFVSRTAPGAGLSPCSGADPGQPEEQKSFYPDGSPEQVETIQNGQLNGERRRYHANGQLSEVEVLKDGLRDGEARRFDSQGPALDRALQGRKTRRARGAHLRHR